MAQQAAVTVPTASLHNKVAIVTGSSRGIGRGIALELARRGCSLVINYVNSKAAADEVVDEIHSLNNGARAVAIQADVSKLSEITRLFEESRKQLGKINIVMSNSGTEAWDKVEDITEEKFDYVYNLNTKAQFFVAQAAFKYCEQGGRVILMSSIAAGLASVKNHALYNSSKMAVIGLVKALPIDFGEKGITVNAIAPGGIKSDMFTDNAWHYVPGGNPGMSADKVEDLIAAQCPLGRCAVPDDVARVVAFLGSDDGGWVNGQVITVAGGSST